MEAICRSLERHQDDPPQFQGINLNKSTVPGRRALLSSSHDPVQENIERVVDLCARELEEPFGPLLQRKSPEKSAKVKVDQGILDFLIFNYDTWPSDMQDPVDLAKMKLID